ncbi:S9 family peptidase [Spartinivicinus poritis]|uniref:S9 family peptidase n=1 Tax=Spartinivicinus poritis TaxID=2994640 RepID=A0ABT5UIY2_9GAMM|nr:S9 family peptidase [Spartinivicinus sp. A2-2]MDE1465388.1 S9 family peptidase [Spartinivicinus sp. A2-2]
MKQCSNGSIIWLASLAILLISNNVVSTPVENTVNMLKSPPVAKQQPKMLKVHGEERVDPYFWLRDDERKAQPVLDYLQAENNYTQTSLKPVSHLQEQLYQEMIGRLEKDDSSVPYQRGDYWYYSRFEGDDEYEKLCRRKGHLTATETIILDLNQRAEPYNYYQLGEAEVSFNQQLLAFSEDTQGRRQYSIHIKSLTTGKLLTDELTGTSGDIAWASDNKTLFYTRKHPKTLLPYQVYRHELGTDQKQDQLVYEETDNQFYISLYTTKSHQYVVIELTSTRTSDIKLIDANNPLAKPVSFVSRESGHEYEVVDVADKFFIRTNWQAENFRLMTVDKRHMGDKQVWQEVVPHRADIFLEDLEAFKGFLVIAERTNGLLQLRIRQLSDNKDHYLDFGEPAYTAYIGHNEELDTEILRFGYSSLTTPDSVFDYNMRTRQKVLLKQDKVVGAFKPSLYQSERLMVAARDGTKVPVSLVYRKGFRRQAGHPLLIYGYGAYGSSLDPFFSSARLSLLDRGVVYALAHVRGGEDLGRQWYEAGRLDHKLNSFNDFIDVTRYLVSAGYGAADNVFAMGGSAGGLLVGAVANMAPELYRGIVAEVPFVDVLTTMLDETIPLTTNEYEEWGNPHERHAYEYIKSYSPYDNITRQAYPNMLITAGLHDSQVQYWEPAKWVAKLRQHDTSNNQILLYTEMEAGHSGVSGRYQAYRELAMEYAFVLHHAGVDD